jgi:hypothetical protein
MANGRRPIRRPSRLPGGVQSKKAPGINSGVPFNLVFYHQLTREVQAGSTSGGGVDIASVEVSFKKNQNPSLNVGKDEHHSS